MASTRKALVSEENGVAKVVSGVPIPALEQDQVLVKVAAVGLNPTDWKHIDFRSRKDAIVGCDYVGQVVKVGSEDKAKYKIGDLVAGVAHGVNAVNPTTGAFAEYTIAEESLSLLVPANITLEQAATLGISVTTVGQGLYQSLGLPFPGEQTGTTDLLIYGGSSATGLLAIQYAKLSGAKVAVTCSPSNNELVKSYGADAAFNYKDPDCGEQINKYFGGQLEKVFDTISTKQTIAICSAAIGPNGGHWSGLLPAAEKPRADVKYSDTLAYTAFGRPFKFFNRDMPATPQDRVFGSKFWSLSQSLLAEGKIKTAPLVVSDGGLERINEGLDKLRSNKVSGQKLVYIIDASIQR